MGWLGGRLDGAGRDVGGEQHRCTHLGEEAHSWRVRRGPLHIWRGRACCPDSPGRGHIWRAALGAQLGGFFMHIWGAESQRGVHIWKGWAAGGTNIWLALLTAGEGVPPAWGAQLDSCLKAHGCPGTSGEAVGSASRTSGGRRQAGTHLGAHLAAGSGGAHIWRACTNTRHSPTRTRAAASCTSGPPAHIWPRQPPPRSPSAGFNGNPGGFGLGGGSTRPAAAAMGSRGWHVARTGWGWRPETKELDPHG